MDDWDIGAARSNDLTRSSKGQKTQEIDMNRVPMRGLNLTYVIGPLGIVGKGPTASVEW